MERRHEVEHGEGASFSKIIEDLVDAGNEELSKGAEGVGLHVVHGISGVSGFL